MGYPVTEDGRRLAEFFLKRPGEVWDLYALEKALGMDKDDLSHWCSDRVRSISGHTVGEYQPFVGKFHRLGRAHYAYFPQGVPEEFRDQVSTPRRRRRKVTTTTPTTAPRPSTGQATTTALRAGDVLEVVRVLGVAGNKLLLADVNGDLWAAKQLEGLLS